MRFIVYREEIAGYIEAESWGIATAHAYQQFGQGVTRVQPMSSSDSDDRADRERLRLKLYRSGGDDAA